MITETATAQPAPHKPTRLVRRKASEWVYVFRVRGLTVELVDHYEDNADAISVARDGRECEVAVPEMCTSTGLLAVAMELEDSEAAYDRACEIMRRMRRILTDELGAIVVCGFERVPS